MSLGSKLEELTKAVTELAKALRDSTVVTQQQMNFIAESVAKISDCKDKVKGEDEVEVEVEVEVVPDVNPDALRADLLKACKEKVHESIENKDKIIDIVHRFKRADGQQCQSFKNLKGDDLSEFKAIFEETFNA